MTERCCNTVDGPDCLAPPGWDVQATPASLCTCFACGEDVCKACSSIVHYRWNKRLVRMCMGCQIERKAKEAP